MTNLIDNQAPHGEFRVIADNFGQCIDQARVAAEPAQSRPGFEHRTVTIFDDKGVIV